MKKKIKLCGEKVLGEAFRASMHITAGRAFQEEGQGKGLEARRL